MAWLIGILLVVLNNLVLLVWKPWTSAYSGEKGKNLARKEDLEKILDEVREVTRAQKQMESRIAGELWEQQWRLNQKLDIYSHLLRAINDYVVWLADYIDGRRMGTAYTTEKTPSEIAEQFLSAYALASVFLSPQSMGLVESIKPKLFYHSGMWKEDDPLCDHAEKGHDELKKLREELVTSTKADLAGQANDRSLAAGQR